MNRTLRNLTFSALVLLGSLGGLELGLRVLGLPDPGLYAGDPGYFWTLRPSLDLEVRFPEEGTHFHVRTDSAGFRGPDPADGAIWCLGDSTTFGWGVEEDEAWPARLGALLGRPVINGGVPGYSTEQGLKIAPRVLEHHPSRVILAYLVRDVELALGEDRDRRPSPPWQILKWMASFRPPAPPVVQGVPRVGVARYVENLQALGQMFPGAVYLAFPMQAVPSAHVEAARALCDRMTCLEPSLPADAFFAHDPIHLNPRGHQQLASLVAEVL